MRILALALPLALPLMLALSACGSDPEPEATPTPSPTQTVAGPRTLVAAGFDDLTLGLRIEGPQGDEVESTVSFEGRTIAEILSYVACPGAGEEEAGDAPSTADDPSGACDPATRPADTVYTYVHRVTPGEDADGPMTSFRTTRRAGGFANAIGFDREQAEAALGEDYAIGVQIDNGQLIWRIEKGDGWTAGEEITFFWQSNYPPEGPAEAYEIETPESRARATGPWPPATMPEPEGIENIPGGD